MSRSPSSVARIDGRDELVVHSHVFHIGEPAERQCEPGIASAMPERPGLLAESSEAHRLLFT